MAAKKLDQATVASQPTPEPPPTLFDEFAPGELAGLVAALQEDPLDRNTYVVAHTLDSVSGQAELFFGRPRLNEGGDDAWYWRVNLIGEPPTEIGQSDQPPRPSGPPDAVPDAPVRLRRRDAEKPRSREAEKQQ